MAKKKVAEKEAEPTKPTLSPIMYMDHDDKNYYIQVELPGVKKEDAELEVSDQSFCVRGERADVEFLGCFGLTHTVNAGSAEAKFDNGLLSIKIPIKKILKGRKITIE